MQNHVSFISNFLNEIYKIWIRNHLLETIRHNKWLWYEFTCLIDCVYLLYYFSPKFNCINGKKVESYQLWIKLWKQRYLLMIFPRVFNLNPPFKNNFILKQLSIWWHVKIVIFHRWRVCINATSLLHGRLWLMYVIGRKSFILLHRISVRT